MDIHSVIQSQYLASLAMLKQAIVKCPGELWDSPQDKNPFWFTSYHALYYAHLYLQETREDFVRWRNHGKPVSTAPLSKEELLGYLDYVEHEVLIRIPALNLGADSGFHGFQIDKLELQFVNIRHIQQHTGELYERLGARGNVKLAWAEKRHRVKSEI